MRGMQLTTGIVVNGKIVIEGEPLPDGTVVIILAREAHETFEVPPELEAEFLESIAEADRGETISADELLQRLREEVEEQATAEAYSRRSDSPDAAFDPTVWERRRG